MDDKLTKTYLQIIAAGERGLVTEQANERTGYKGPRLITCMITDPIDLAIANGMTYDEFYADLVKMVSSFRKFGVTADTQRKQKGVKGNRITITLCAEPRDVRNFLKVRTIGAKADPDAATVIYDLSEGRLVPADADADPIGALDGCPLAKATGIDYDDFYRDTRDGSSNVERVFLSEEYLDRAKKALGKGGKGERAKADHLLNHGPARPR